MQFLKNDYYSNRTVIVFAGDSVICIESRELLEVYGSKTEYMCVNERETGVPVKLKAVEELMVDEFEYPKSTIQSNGQCARVVKKRVQAGWRGMSGVISDMIEANEKGKAYKMTVRPAVMHGLETETHRKQS